MNILKISAKSSPNMVAGALAAEIRNCGTAELQAIGAGAVNQAVKAIAVARGFMSPVGVELICFPAFTEVELDGEKRTAISLRVETRAVQ